MGLVVLRRTILVILSTCYTNGLELTDLYPYGTEHGDALSIGSGLYRPTSLLAPIDNLVIFSPTPAGLTAARYRGSNFQLIVVSTGCNTFGIALYVDVNITSATTGIGSNINGNSVPPDPSFFPFGTTVMDAPTMMLNSTIPGTYIFPLNHIPPAKIKGLTVVIKPTEHSHQYHSVIL